MPRRRRRPPRAGALTELPPLRILAQIAVLQAAFYAGAIVLLGLSALTAGTAFGPDLVLGWEAVRADTTHGWMLAFVWALNGGFFMAIVIMLLIARSKLVADFALTMHAIHAVICTAYDGRVPRNPLWWVAMAASSALAISLGLWGCRQRELRPIFFGGGGAAAAGPAPLAARRESAEQQLMDDPGGFTRGRARGRGRDGAGEYELVKVLPAEQPDR